MGCLWPFEELTPDGRVLADVPPPFAGRHCTLEQEVVRTPAGLLAFFIAKPVRGS